MTREGRVPAQFTSEEGAGRDLYACHNKDAVFARLLSSRSGRRPRDEAGAGDRGRCIPNLRTVSRVTQTRVGPRTYPVSLVFEQEFGGL